MPEAVSDAALLADQRAYYRLGAPEYDEWWQRRGGYDQADAQHRVLNDRSEHRLVKIFYKPGELAAGGVDAHIDATSLFVFGWVPPRG